MAPLRSNSRRALLILLHTCLCLAVLMQMLGTPVSLLDPHVDLDPVYESLLDGFSLPPHHMTMPPLAIAYRAPDVYLQRRSIMPEKNPFRPPSPPQSDPSLAS